MKQLLLLAAFVVALVPALLAQDKPADNMQLMIEKLKADKKLLIAENMGMTEAEAQAFWPVYDEYQKSIGDINQKIGKMVERYAQSYGKMTDPEAKSLIDEYMKLEGDYLKMRESYLPKFRKVLPDIKVTRYYQIENKIRAAFNYELAAQIPLMK
jgi:hypothetical protein